jgi:high-affinity Fe2+/Pb2+ permease
MKDKKNVWAVLGMSNRAKDIAKKLAKKAGKNMGPWLEEALYYLEELDNMNNSSKDQDDLKSMSGAGGSSLIHHKPHAFQDTIKQKPFGHAEFIMLEKQYLDDIHVKLDDLTKQVASLAMQIYDLKIYGKFEKKSFWSRFS